MAGHDLRPPPGREHAAAGAVVDGYRAALAARLVGSGRARAAILAEVTGGLWDAVEAREAAGLAPDAAARAAVAEFGDPAELAALFAAEQAGTAAHRTGVRLLVTGPLVGVAWLAAYAARDGDWHRFPPVLAELPAVPLVLAVAVPAALLAAAGPLVHRWRLPFRPDWVLAPRRAARAALVAACATVTGDGALLAALAVTAAHGTAWPWPAAVAAAASLLRLSLAATAATGLRTRLRAGYRD